MLKVGCPALLIWNSLLNRLNKQRYPLFKVESRDLDILCRFYIESWMEKTTLWYKILLFSQANVTSQNSSSLESFFQHSPEFFFKDQLNLEVIFRIFFGIHWSWCPDFGRMITLILMTLRYCLLNSFLRIIFRNILVNWNFSESFWITFLESSWPTLPTQAADMFRLWSHLHNCVDYWKIYNSWTLVAGVH